MRKFMLALSLTVLTGTTFVQPSLQAASPTQAKGPEIQTNLNSPAVKITQAQCGPCNSNSTVKGVVNVTWTTSLPPSTATSPSTIVLVKHKVDVKVISCFGSPITNEFGSVEVGGASRNAKVGTNAIRLDGCSCQVTVTVFYKDSASATQVKSRAFNQTFNLPQIP